MQRTTIWPLCRLLKILGQSKNILNFLIRYFENFFLVIYYKKVFEFSILWISPQNKKNSKMLGSFLMQLLKFFFDGPREHHLPILGY